MIYIPLYSACYQVYERKIIYNYGLHAKLISIINKFRKGYFPRGPRLNKYRLIHGHFHIGLVIIPRPPYWPETESKANMGRGMITRPIWKCPCINLFITYFRHLEKRHLYWPETKSRPILAQANMSLDMEMIL
jgi:hypothetical protein